MNVKVFIFLFLEKSGFQPPYNIENGMVCIYLYIIFDYVRLLKNININLIILKCCLNINFTFVPFILNNYEFFSFYYYFCSID